jgi:cobalt-zinc-cadmium efflux system outer membrane protein
MNETKCESAHLPSRLQGFLTAAILFLVAPGFVHAQAAAIGRGEVALSLVEAERMMLAKNRELQAARRMQEGARADSMTADRAPNPTLSLQTVNINPKLGVGSGGFRDKTVDTSVRIDQVIERGGKRELRVQTGRALEAAADADYADVLRQQRQSLRSAYYDLALAQEKTAILGDTAGLFERSLDAADRRLKAGDIAAADLSRMRVDALRAMNDARAAEAERARAQVALAYLVGAEASARSIRAVDPWPKSTEYAGGLDPDLIDRRPDVRAAKARVEASDRARELARRLRTRDISVGMQFEHFPSGPADGAGNSYGVGISIPLFVSHAYEGEIRRAEVDLDAARDNLERVRALATGELSRAWADLQSSAERVRRYNDTLLGEARRSAEAAEFAYKNGALGIMDLLDARRTLRATQIDAATAQAEHGKAIAAWEAGIATRND